MLKKCTMKKKRMKSHSVFHSDVKNGKNLKKKKKKKKF